MTEPFNVGKRRRFAVVYDEAVAAKSAQATSKCDRMPNNEPHRHFSVLQFELADDCSTVIDMSVNPGLHSAEVRQVVEGLANDGVIFHYNKNVADRIEDTKLQKVITLKRETIGENPAVPWYWVDVRDRTDDKKVLKPIGQYDDNIDGYVRARRYMLQISSDMNIPYRDYIEEAVVGGK